MPRPSRPRSRSLAAASALIAVLAAGQPVSDAPFAIRRTWTLQAQDFGDRPGLESHELRLHLVTAAGSRWSAQRILEGVRGAARILAQCGIATRSAVLDEVAAPAAFRVFATPLSRELARRTGAYRPTVFFVDDTLQRPAFDAEAIGHANARGRPELTDTVWITAATPHLAVALAHELAHVLSESGAHSDLPHNLMRDETAPGNDRLTAAQCQALRDTGTKKRLVAPLP